MPPWERGDAAGRRACVGPLFCPDYALPTKTRVDVELVGGAALFGLGWGLVGFCVGPAIAAMAFGDSKVYVFVAAMVAGAWITKLVQGGRFGVASAARQARSAGAQGSANITFLPYLDLNPATPAR